MHTPQDFGILSTTVLLGLVQKSTFPIGCAHVLCWNATETSSSPQGIGTLHRSNPSPLLAAKSITRVKSLKKLSGDSLALSRKKTCFRTKKLQKLIDICLKSESEGRYLIEGKTDHARTCRFRKTFVTRG